METASKPRNSENTFSNMILYVNKQWDELEDFSFTGWMIPARDWTMLMPDPCLREIPHATF